MMIELQAAIILEVAEKGCEDRNCLFRTALLALSAAKDLYRSGPTSALDIQEHGLSWSTSAATGEVLRSVGASFVLLRWVLVSIT